MDGKALRYAFELPSQRYALWRGAGPLTGPFASTRLNVTSTRIGKVVCRNFATSPKQLADMDANTWSHCPSSVGPTLAKSIYW